MLTIDPENELFSEIYGQIIGYDATIKLPNSDESKTYLIRDYDCLTKQLKISPMPDPETGEMEAGIWVDAQSLEINI